MRADLLLEACVRSIVTVSSDRSTEAHSAAFLKVPQRDFWWSRDFLALVARRLDLSTVQHVLDVGAGIGHWSTALLAVLPPNATLVGLDPEPRWVKQAQREKEELGVGERCRFVQGVAEQLPFEEKSFDLVSCQTLLIHVPDPVAVIAEMRRVVRPGGLLLLSEPNNLSGMLVADTVIADKPVADWVERVEFALICERGKAALGEGNNSIGDLLPGLLAKAGFVEIETSINERAWPLVPPYATAEQQALKSMILSMPDDAPWGWPAPDTKRYFIAGGGDPETFERRWQLRLDEHRQVRAELRAGQFHTAGGGIHYLISAGRPG